MINKIFYNNKIQWAAVAAVVSLVGIGVTFFSTWYINKKTIKANISSKTRIEWINQIRKLSADAITSITLLISASKHSYAEQLNIAVQNAEIEKAYNMSMNTGIQNIGPQMSKESSKKSKALHDENYNEYITTIYTSFNQLFLFFPDKKNHDSITNTMDKILQILGNLSDHKRKKIESNKSEEYYQTKISEHNEIVEELQSAVFEFKNEISEYLSLEWKKASAGK